MNKKVYNNASRMYRLPRGSLRRLSVLGVNPRCSSMGGRVRRVSRGRQRPGVGRKVSTIAPRTGSSVVLFEKDLREKKIKIAKHVVDCFAHVFGPNLFATRPIYRDVKRV